MNRYRYSGPVMEFERCIAFNWKAETSAETEGKARSNLTYRFKKENNRTPNASIRLPGELVMIK